MPSFDPEEPVYAAHQFLTVEASEKESWLDAFLSVMSREDLQMIERRARELAVPLTEDAKREAERLKNEVSASSPTTAACLSSSPLDPPSPHERGRELDRVFLVMSSSREEDERGRGEREEGGGVGAKLERRLHRQP